jgi:O-antigen biosynthesis protein
LAQLATTVHFAVTKSRPRPLLLPSLDGFTPKFYRGGPIHFYLPILYDLVAIQEPRLIVAIGFGEGEAFFTFCQAVRERRIDGRCIGIHRDKKGDGSKDDGWELGRAYGKEFYNELTQLVAGAPTELASSFANGDVGLLLIDDCDSGTTVREELAAWKPRLASDAIVLVHGIGLERKNGPRQAWSQFASPSSHLEFHEGIGLGIALGKQSLKRQPELRRRLLARDKELMQLYRLIAEKVGGQIRAAQAEERSAALEARQIWVDSLIGDRWKAQQVMDHQVRVISDLESKFEPLERDRRKAQEIMDAQARELQAQTQGLRDLRRDRGEAQLVIDMQAATLSELHGKMQNLKKELKEHKMILKAAKEACRKRGRCFQISHGPKIKRPIPERIAREFARLPRNLRRMFGPEGKSPETKFAPALPLTDPIERYAAWIQEHEPSADELSRQRDASQRWTARPKISLLLPVHHTPAQFLDELLTSAATQTYDNWELCLVDGGSTNPETAKILKHWETRDGRLRILRLPENLGISENTNRAFELATGDYLTCIDHDDLLAPFALYEIARAIAQFPTADILYSDEDRWGANGTRHSPFFKPEWSPALLQSFMYLGHLTVYRRELVAALGGFRKQFDFSQDYDFALRATEIAREIRHIPSVLYHWREHPASGSTGGKPGARQTNLAALEDAMRRRNLPAEIIEYSTANRARLRILNWPKVTVVIPTDSGERAWACLTNLQRTTDYPDWEIVLVTNSSLAAALEGTKAKDLTRFVRYDKAFNFSEKCNLGAEAGSGQRVIFFNDDVEPAQADWIQNLIEPLENPEVGAVAPKMLYATGKIQHAGLVTGVRGLIGTAFHQRPADSTEHFNLAQSMREVSALSGACLAMRREDFLRLGGFDISNTPIAGSDLDLSFKIREAGWRCLYTPFATLRHTGHVSIGHEEKKVAAPRRDKSSIFLLKRWAGYTTHDPYFTDNMRDWLYTDSPTPIRMSGRNQTTPIESQADLLFISHDFSLSGAPMMLLYAAISCQRNGFFVVVMSPKDGPSRQKFDVAGIPVIIDPLIITGHESLAKFARNFDCLIANTIFSAPVIRALRTEKLPILWWLHEAKVGEHYLRQDANLRMTLPLADIVVTPSGYAAEVYQPFRAQPVKWIPNAIPDPKPGRTLSHHNTRMRFLVLGTVEPRKGQDIFVQALGLLPLESRAGADFQMAGRVMDPEFGSRVKAIGAAVKNLAINEAVGHAQAIDLLESADVVVFPSRDEAMPTVTMLEAMSLGKAIVSTTVGGATEFIRHGENGLLVEPEAPQALAGAIEQLIKEPALARELGSNARATYERSFTIERFGGEFRDLIMETLARSKNAHSAAVR